MERTLSYLFYNETGITDKIDIAIWASMNNIDEIKRELQKYKLDLIMGEKEVPSLVISDPVKVGNGKSCEGSKL